MRRQMLLPTMRWIAGHNWLLLLCTAALVGAAVYSAFASRPATPRLDAALGASATFEGIITKEPDVRDTSILLTLSVEKVNDTGAAGRILVSADTFTHLAYGDRIAAFGKLELPQPFQTDTDRTFDYPKYLLAQGVTHVLPFAQVQVLAHGQGNGVVAALLSVKHFLESGINAALPEPESSLAGGLLLGDKQSLGAAITQAFRRAGVVHIIVLSGYNVSIIIGSILFISLYFLPKRFALLVAALSVVAFAVMTGASETTIRAGVMALIALFAKALNRPADGMRILLITAAGMAVWNPYLVLYDLSYQLSVLSTLGLTLFSDGVQKKILFIPEALGLREIVATTLATQLTVLPLLILSVGQVSIVSLFTNVLVLPAVPLGMLASFIAALFASFSSVLAFPFSIIAYGILHYIISVSVWFGSLPFSAIPVPEEWLWPSIAALFGVYAITFAAIAYKRKTLV